MSTWGYVRISTSLQNPERQSRNIKKEFPYVVIVQEAYTGTNFIGIHNKMKGGKPNEYSIGTRYRT